jgi:plastocyanin
VTHRRGEQAGRMSTSSIRRTLLAVLAFALLAPATAAATTRTVSVRDDFFAAKTVTIARGDTVRWVWRGRHKHDVASTAFGNSKMQRRGTFTVRFGNAGRYQYYCGLHEGMAGTVIVRR